MSNNKIVLAIAALVVVGLAWFFLVHKGGMPVGAVSTTCQGSTTCFGDLYVTSQFSGATGALKTDGTAIFGAAMSDLAGLVTLGSGTGAVNTQQYNPTCNTASTTLFSIGPVTATSTFWVTGQVGGNATTSSLYIGTSTTPNGTTSGTNVVASSNGIATSTVIWFTSGITDVPPNFIAAANNVYAITVVPPNYLDGYSTSTATAAGSNGYSPTEPTCNIRAVQTY